MTFNIFRKTLSAVLPLLMIFGFTSCGNSMKEYKREIYALDTLITVTAYGENAEAGVNEAVKEIMRLGHLFSVTDPESEISKINASAGKTVTVSKETAALISKAVDISSSTNGAFDISVYPLVSLWGFTTGDYKVPDEPQISAALEKTDYRDITVDGVSVKIEKGMSLDLGGIAKGYISGRVKDILKSRGVGSAVIDLGGNIQTLGLRADGNKWKIGIKDPHSDGNFAVLSCEETAVVTSGAYERNFTENGVTYHHIIDPSTGYPADSGIESATVISEDPALADALSTAFFIMGAERSCETAAKLGVNYIILTTDGELYISDTIAESLSVEDSSYNVKN